MKTLLALLGLLIGQVWIVDGDTIHTEFRKYRMSNYDTPEHYPRARCPEEDDLARKATARLAELMKSCGYEIKPLGTSCKYDRECAILLVGNKDIAERAVAEGWGQYWNGKRPKPDWCPAPISFNPKPGC